MVRRMRLGPVISVKRHPDCVVIQLPQTSYLITRWPQFRFGRLSKFGDIASTSPALFKPLFKTLEELRVGIRRDWRLAVYGLVGELPMAFHTRLAPMGSRYWFGVSLLSRFPASSELLVASPGIFASAAIYLGENQLSSDFPPFDFSHKLRDIASSLGFPRTNAACRVLDKFESYDLSLQEWSDIGRNLRLPEIARSLEVSPVIPRQAMDLIMFPRLGDFLSPRAQRECMRACLSYRMPCARTFAESLKMWALLRRTVGVSQGAASMREFERIFESGVVFAGEVPISKGPDLMLAGVSPLLSVRAIRGEGDMMEHCLGGREHVLDGVSGKACYYSVTTPERLTSGLKRIPGTTDWMLDQIKGARNVAPSHIARAELIEALNSAGVGIPKGAHGCEPF